MMKKYILYITIALGVSMSFAGFISSDTTALTCQGTETSIIGGDICGEESDGDGSGDGNIENTVIWTILQWVINIMAAGVAVLAVGGLIYGGILYTTSSGSPEQTKKAMSVILNVVIGIVAFALMWAFMQWIVPGGIF